ncbi:MAG TPA: HD domain-containing protein [Thermomicrobiales bacterium]|nr:HD domain-containing protein [Thermomicrobiales bacterium]
MTDGREAGEETPVDWAALAKMLSTVGRLKQTPRTGWLDRGVAPAATESVADHAFRVALLAWAVAQLPGEDRMENHGAIADPGRVLLLALAHDLPEAIAGDPTPYRSEDIPAGDDPAARRTFLDQRQERNPERAAVKRAAEVAAIDQLLAGLPPDIRETLHDAWWEYEEQRTPAARLVKQADRLETYLQSREYLRDDPSLPMRSFALQIDDPATLPDDRMRSLRDAITDGVRATDQDDEPGPSR